MAVSEQGTLLAPDLQRTSRVLWLWLWPFPQVQDNTMSLFLRVQEIGHRH